MKRIFSLLLFLIFTAGLTLALLHFVQIQGDVEINTPENMNRVFAATTKHEKANNKHEAVDLGLSVKWASCNVGANSPEKHGGYYAWGETEEKSDYSQETYKHIDSGGYKYIGSNICGSPYDVAHMKWGGSWRMPTLEEIEELCNKCCWKRTSVKNITGYRVTGPNGNSIFLPATGTFNGTKVYYPEIQGLIWSGSLSKISRSHAYGLGYFFLNGNSYECEENYRHLGRTVRPVTE